MNPSLIARLRLDAALYASAPPRQPGQQGRPPLKALLDQADVTWASVSVAWYDGTTRTVELTSQTAIWYRSGKPPVIIRWVLIRDPQGAFAPQALLCTDPAADPTQILEWFVLRWQLEVTFQEVRTHLGVETQRQWSDLAIARTTPVLLGLFSWTTLAAHALQKRHSITQRTAAWYDKPSPTFVDAIARAMASPVAGVGGFLAVGRRPRYSGTPRHSVPPTCRFPCLRRLKCVKPRLALGTFFLGPSRWQASKISKLWALPSHGLGIEDTQNQVRCRIAARAIPKARSWFVSLYFNCRTASAYKTAVNPAGRLAS